MNRACWYCPGTLEIVSEADDKTWQGHAVHVQVWTCPQCGNGRVVRRGPIQYVQQMPLFNHDEQGEEQPT
jgi:hypothetical protein